MGFYTIRSHSGNGYYLNVNTTSLLNGRTNVIITTYNGGNKQKWLINSLGSGVKVHSLSNVNYMLNANSSSNCDVYTTNSDVYINFIKVSNNVYRLQLKSNTQKYLTVNSSSAGTQAKWAALNTSDNGQLWQVRSTTCDYIFGNAWLKMYTSASGYNGRTVSIPTVNDFTGSDGYSYKFTNKAYWFAQEPPYNKTINSYAYDQIKSVTGQAPVIKAGLANEYLDGDGKYWIAVGPNVVNPNHKKNATITPAEMYAKGSLDVVVKDEYGTAYYIPAVVGDAKNHTWDNGVIQTFRSYPSGTFESAKGNFNGQVCAEFIGNVSLSGLGSFSIDKILFYDR